MIISLTGKPCLIKFSEVFGILAVLDFHCLIQTFSIQCAGSVVAEHRLNCPEACEILVAPPGIQLVYPASEGRFLTIGPPGKSPVESFFNPDGKLCKGLD